MLVRARYVLIFSLLSVLFNQDLFAQTTITFKVRDSEKGFKIEHFTVDIGESPSTITTSLIASDSFIYTIPHGVTKWFSFHAQGHKPLTTHFKGDSTLHHLTVEIHLDPLNETPFPIAPPRKNVYQIFVLDGKTHAPIKGANVSIEFKGEMVGNGITDSSGQTIIFVDKMNLQRDEVEFGNLIVKKNGYCTHKKQDILLNSDNARMVIELKREINGPCETIDFMEPGALQGTQLKEEPYSQQSNQQSFRFQNNGGTTIMGFIGPPSSIRVGTSCQCTSCSGVSVLSLETYVRRGLDDEWIASWPDNSLRSGAIAYRSYGAWHVYNPISTNYDICNTPCCQAFDYADIYTKSSNAAIYVAGFMLEKSNGSLAKAYYSAENNKGGGDCNTSYFNCNDGWAGRPSWGFPCISDNVCSGTVGCGHGAGECQWGTMRWANQGMSWKWIVEHYYSGVNWSISSPLRITSASVGSATCITSGCSMVINLNVENAAEYPHNQIMIGASIYNGTYFSDPPNDVGITAPVGISSHSRNFVIPSSAPTGTYDLIVALWFDVDENNQINTGDLLLHTYTIPNALTIVDNPSGLNVTASCSPSGLTAQFSWTGTAPCYSLDISTDPSFSWYYSKNVSNAQSTVGPTGFTCVTGSCPYGYSLVFQYGQTYYWRIRTDCGSVNGPSFTTPSKPTASFTVSGTCVNNPVSFSSTSSGNISSYFWDFGDGHTGNGSSIQHQYASTGSFTVRHIVITPEGCSDTAIQTISLQSPPIAGFSFSVQSGYTVSFHDQSQYANSWYWNFGDGNTSTVQNPTHTYQSAGTYIVTQQVSNSCGTHSATDTVSLNPPLSAILDSIKNVSCNGGNDGVIFITVNGGVPPYTYSWSNGATTEDLINVPAGQYTNTITDAGGNTVTIGPYTISEPPPITITASNIQNAKCYGESSGAIHINVSGGTPPFSYSWSNGATTQNLTNIPAGHYTVTIIDANGCIKSSTFTIQQPPPISVSIDTSALPNVNATTSGGTPPYTCQWNTGDTGCSIIVTSTGTYIVTVRDQNGCQDSDTAFIKVESPTGNLSITKVSKCTTRTHQSLITITCPDTHIEKISIVSMTGQEVMRITPNNINQITLKESLLPTGVYTILIKTSNGYTTRKLIVVVN
ncbi:MAG: PKD domain-containing protein [Chlorobi bacterium]|nr:PKD domain-containing protein [Chlorobiota bacterium]